MIFSIETWGEGRGGGREEGRRGSHNPQARQWRLLQWAGSGHHTTQQSCDGEGIIVLFVMIRYSFKQVYADIIKDI
jgi:hypothetical protein